MATTKQVYEEALERIAEARRGRRDFEKELRESGITAAKITFVDLDKLELDIQTALKKL